MRELRRDLLPLIFLALVSSVAFFNLTALPIFEDEGSQLHLAWRALEGGEWLRPLGFGKPLEVWPMTAIVGMAEYPLPLIRGLHVIAGIISVLLVYRLALRANASRGTALAAAVLFAVCPFTVYLQRLALSDIFLCAAGTWVLVATMTLLQEPSRRAVVSLACALVLAAFCKFPVGFVFLISAPLALLAMRADEHRSRLEGSALLKLLCAHLPALLLALAVAVTVFVQWRQGNSLGFGLADFIGVGLGRYENVASALGIPNINLLDELSAQLSWTVIALAIVGLAGAGFLGRWQDRWLIGMGLLPMLVIGLLANFWYSRYLLFTLPPLAIASVEGWRLLALRAARFRVPLSLAAFAIAASFMAYQSLWIIVDPPAAHWSALDRMQYFEGWSSGYGFREAARFVRESSFAPKTIFALDGHSAEQLLAYLPREWRGRVKSVAYGGDGKPLRSEALRFDYLQSQSPAWIVISDRVLQHYLESNFGAAGGGRLDIREMSHFDKPGGRGALGIYEVTLR